jgi:hypothetical protein
VWESQNKVLVSILGLDETGKLSNSSTNTLRTNIATYLSDYRMLNDYVEIANGKIYNLGFEVDLFIDKQFPQSQIINETINSITRYMDINNFDMGDNIFLSQLLEIINNVGGVLNVVDLRVYNKVGNNVYSLNEVSQPYSDAETKQIDLLGQFTLFGEPNAMFEVRVPIKDILVRVKN